MHINPVSNIGITGRVSILVVAAVIGVLAVGVLSLLNLDRQLLQQKQVELKHNMQIAVTVIDGFRDRTARGEMTEADAKGAAMDAVRNIRFGDDEYFFIYDMQGVNLMHPAKPELQGKNLIDLKDQRGNRLIAGLIETAKAGGGPYEFYWVKPGDQEATLKLGYAMAVPQWDWMVGTGFHVQDLNAIRKASSIDLVVELGTVLVVLTLIAVFVARSTVRPLMRLAASMERLRSGDVDAAIAGVDRRDEIGSIARSVDSFRDVQRSRLAAEENRLRLMEAEQVRSSTLDRLTREFDALVSGVVDKLADAAQALETSANTLTVSTEQTRSQAAAVAEASEIASRNVSSVASATEELSSSVGEITRQVTRSTEVSDAALKGVRHTSERMRLLSEATSKIGSIVGLIADIASQTNLLALNATNEAARAGEAGKGYAVVAAEVKQLANQTSKATAEIDSQIRSIQGATTEAVEAISGIDSTIDSMHAVASQISDAVTGQEQATSDIARNVHDAAEGTAVVSGSIVEVSTAVREAGQASSDVLRAATVLGEQAGLLRNEIHRFLTEVRAA